MGKKKSTNNTATARRERDRGNVFGADPHKRSVTATVLDERGDALGTATFRVSGAGHRAMEAWALAFGPITRWGVEGANGVGRHTAMYLAGQGHDVRDVCPMRTAEEGRRRRQGKSDRLDSLRIARETQADAAMPTAFKRASGDAGPDETHELIALWHNARRSMLTTRQHLLNEAEYLLCALPEELRAALPDTKAVRPRLRVLPATPCSDCDAATMLRLRLLHRHAAAIAELDRGDREAAAELARLASKAGSTLHQLCGIAARTEAELLIEVGDPRRFAGEGSFARFNGTAPLPASSAEGDGEPVRHRLNRGGNRRVNACLHRIAITQLRCDARARAIYDNARRRGHTKKEAMRVLKRHLSDVVYRHMRQDLHRYLEHTTPPPRAA